MEQSDERDELLRRCGKAPGEIVDLAFLMVKYAARAGRAAEFRQMVCCHDNLAALELYIRRARSVLDGAFQAERALEAMGGKMEGF